MRGVHNSFVVVKRPIKLFYNFSFRAFGDFIFLRAQKNEAKKGRPCGGLAQRKPFVCKHKRRWPFEFGWTTDVRCETDSRAVRDGFTGSLHVIIQLRVEIIAH